MASQDSVSFSLFDIRHHPRQQEDLILLNQIQKALEEDIKSFIISNSENLFDQEFDQILRSVEFTRRPESYQIVLAPNGFIRWSSDRCPSSLICEVHNSLICLLAETKIVSIAGRIPN